MKGRSVTLILLISTVVAFILQLTVDGLFNGLFTNLFYMHTPDIFVRPWMLITHMFLHGSPMHLLFNMLVLYMFGSMLENRLGQKRFLLFYFGAGLIGAIVYLINDILTAFLFGSPMLGAYGASGATMGIMGVLMILAPRTPVILFIFPTTLRIAVLLFIGFDLFNALTGSFPGIGYAAHLGGVATGIIYGLVLSKQKKRFEKTFYKPPKSSTHSGDTIELSEDDMNAYIRNGRL